MHLHNGDVKTILTMRNARGTTFYNTRVFLEIFLTFSHPLQAYDKV